MPADLTISSLTHRNDVLVDRDSLVILEHEMTKDRMRRILFDRVESVVVWRTIPTGRVTAVCVLLGVPALLLLLLGLGDNSGIALVFGLILGACAGTILGWYLWCQRTTVRIDRAGQAQDVTVIATPQRVRRFLRKLEAQIRETQLQAIAAALARQPEAEPPAAPEEVSAAGSVEGDQGGAGVPL